MRMKIEEEAIMRGRRKVRLILTLIVAVAVLYLALEGIEIKVSTDSAQEIRTTFKEWEFVDVEADVDVESKPLAEPLAVREVIIPEPYVVLTEREKYLLAKLGMAEAEGEDTIGKALVMRVVLNRKESEDFPNTIEEVIFQRNPCQFSPIINGRWEEVEPDEDCYAALDLVVWHAWDESEGALYFDFLGSDSKWHASREELFVHGGQVFYK